MRNIPLTCLSGSAQCLFFFFAQCLFHPKRGQSEQTEQHETPENQDLDKGTLCHTGGSINKTVE